MRDIDEELPELSIDWLTDITKGPDKIIDDFAYVRRLHLKNDLWWKDHWLVKLARELPETPIPDEFVEGVRLYRGYILFHPDTKILEVHGHTRLGLCPIEYNHHLGSICPCCRWRY